MHDDSDRDDGGQRRQREYPRVHDPRGDVGRDEGATENAEGDAEGDIERSRRKAREFRSTPGPPDEGRGRSDEQPTRPGRRRQIREVDPVGTRDRPAHRRRPTAHHPPGQQVGRDRPREHQRSPARRGAGASEKPHQCERPEHIPLLLHREAPQVSQQWRVPGGEVGDVTDDLPPVGQIPDRPGQIATHLTRLLRGPPEENPHRGDRQHEKQRRQQPTRPTNPE